MPKVTSPVKCPKCGSDRLRHEELAMHGKYGGLGGFVADYNFDVYICEECAYSEFYSRS